MEGDKGDAVYFVISGDLTVVKQTNKDENVAITNLSAGKSIGEMSVIDETPRSATVQAICDSRLLYFPKNSFEELLENHPGIGIKILKGIARQLSMNLRKTASRLADYLLPLG